MGNIKLPLFNTLIQRSTQIIIVVLLFLSSSIFSQTIDVNNPVTLVGSPDTCSGTPGVNGTICFQNAQYTTPPNNASSYHGGSYYNSLLAGTTKEKWGYNITGLTIGNNYTLKIYYKVNRVHGTTTGDRGGNINMSNSTPDVSSLTPVVLQANWDVWYTQEIVFTATATTDQLQIEAEGDINSGIELWVSVDATISVSVNCNAGTAAPKFN